MLALPEILDALVVDVDGWMPLLVVLAEGATLDDDLTRRIADRIRSDCSPRHVPNEVHAIPEVPRTLSGKALEIPVKRILQDGDADAAASRDSPQKPGRARLVRRPRPPHRRRARRSGELGRSEARLSWSKSRPISRAAQGVRGAEAAADRFSRNAATRLRSASLGFTSSSLARGVTRCGRVSADRITVARPQ